MIFLQAADGIDWGKLLDLGLTAVVVMVVVAPLVKWLMKQVESSRDSFLEALKESNAVHAASIKDIGEKMERSVDELAHKIELLAEKVNHAS